MFDEPRLSRSVVDADGRALPIAGILVPSSPVRDGETTSLGISRKQPRGFRASVDALASRKFPPFALGSDGIRGGGMSDPVPGIVRLVHTHTDADAPRASRFRVLHGAELEDEDASSAVTS